MRRVCLYVLLGDDKLNIVGLHFFELLNRVSLLHRDEEMGASLVSIRLAQDLTPTVLACRHGGKDYQLLGREGEVVVGRAARENEIGSFVSLRPNLLFELKLICPENRAEVMLEGFPGTALAAIEDGVRQFYEGLDIRKSVPDLGSICLRFKLSED